MVRGAISRKITLFAGILAALVIVMAQAFQQDARTYLSKIKTETKEIPGSDQKVIVAAPADAVPSGQAAEKADTSATLIREILLDDGTARVVPAVEKTLLSSFLKTLFRTVISPQAP